MKQVRIGIVGFGAMGGQHAGYLTKNKVPKAVLTAVADTDPKKLELAKKKCGQDIQTFSCIEDLLAAKCCDAVILSVPHYFHPPYAIMAMKAGYHVIVEKPAGVYTKQVVEMNEVAKTAGVVYTMMFNQRTNPLYIKVRDLVQGGELGQIKRVIWIITDWYRSQSYYDQGGWRATWSGEGGGVLLNQNPHNLDLWQWICGMPSRVRSQVYYGKHRNIEVEDDVTALVEYPNGATGCYITTVGDAPGTNRLEISGERGKIVVENGKIKFSRLRVPEPEFNATYKGGLGKPEVWEMEVPLGKGSYTSHAGITANFCDAILDGKPLIAPGEEGIKGLMISNAIHLSSWTGGEWVDLPGAEEKFYQMLREKAGGSFISEK